MAYRSKATNEYSMDKWNYRCLRIYQQLYKTRLVTHRDYSPEELGRFAGILSKAAPVDNNEASAYTAFRNVIRLMFNNDDDIVSFIKSIGKYHFCLYCGGNIIKRVCGISNEIDIKYSNASRSFTVQRQQQGLRPSDPDLLNYNDTGVGDNNVETTVNMYGTVVKSEQFVTPKNRRWNNKSSVKKYEYKPVKKATTGDNKGQSPAIDVSTVVPAATVLPVDSPLVTAVEQVVANDGKISWADMTEEAEVTKS